MGTFFTYTCVFVNFYWEFYSTNSNALTLIKFIFNISLTDGLFKGSFSRSLSIKSASSLLYLSGIGVGYSYTILNTSPNKLSA